MKAYTVATIAILAGGFVIIFVAGSIVPQSIDNLRWHGNIANAGWELGGLGFGVLVTTKIRLSPEKAAAPTAP